MQRTEDVKEIVSSLVKFNQEVTKISQDAKNPFFKKSYATLDQIIEQIRPILSSHGLVVMQDISSEENGNITVKTSVMHESGQFIETSGTSLKLSKNDPQGAGAGITYARRYDLSAALSLNTGEDDDGNSVSGNQQQNKTPNSSKKQTYSKPSTQSKTNSKPTTQKKAPAKLSATQKSAIETKSKEFAKLRNQTVGKVMEVLNISDLNLITATYAEKSIATLDGWLKKASEDNDVQSST